MFLILGILIGFNLAVRLVLGEAQELRAKGRVAVRGQTRMTIGDIGSIALRAGIFGVSTTIRTNRSPRPRP